MTTRQVSASMTTWWLVEYRWLFERSAMLWSRVGTRMPSTMSTVSFANRLRGWSASNGPVPRWSMRRPAAD
jgi:hypothetical protein